MALKYGVAIFPSKKLQDLANSYRKRYDTHYALIPPHITLKEPFVADDDKLDEIVAHMKKISDQVSPFNLNVYKVSSFHPANNTIYLGVEHTEELQKLHELMYAEDPDNEPHFSFVPHITIGQDLSNDEHSDVLGSLKMMKIQHEELADRFSLLYQLENGSWTVYETFLLGEGRGK